MWAILVLIFFPMISAVAAQFAATPLDYKHADMLPILEIMAERFLHGQPVYSVIPEIWSGMQPIYLPAMWMPFTISSVFHFDPRWMTVAFFALGILLVLRIANLKPKSWLLMIVLLPVYWMVDGIFSNDMGYFLLTQEGIVVGYYLFLGYALSQDKPYLVGLAASLCMMSRFSFAGWLLAFGLYLLLSKDYRYLLKAGAVFAGVVLVLMVATHAISHLDVFIGLEKTYRNAVRPNNEWKLGPLIDNGLGLARYWGYANLRELHTLFIAVNIVAPILLFGVFLIRKIGALKVLVPLCALKLSLVLFYNMIIIPAGYLFYTSTLFSIVILYYCLSGRKVKGTELVGAT
jgi:hypothetical protein